MSGTKRKTPSNSYKINIALPRMSNGSFGLQITQTLLGSMLKVRIDKCKNTKVKGAAIVDLSGCIIKSINGVKYEGNLRVSTAAGLMKQSKDVLKLTLDCKNKSSTVRVAPQVYSNNNNHITTISSNNNNGTLSSSTATTTISTTQRKKKKQKKKTKNVETEKRAARYCSQPTYGTMERIERAAGQRLFLVTGTDNSTGENLRMDFQVLGSTGNLYSVEISKRPTCTCPDHLRRNNLCKHILFTFIKVLGVSSTNPVIWQKALLQSELKKLFDNASERLAHLGNNIKANSRIIQAVTGVDDGDANKDKDDDGGNVKCREITDDTTCPICFDNILQTDEIVHCRTTCGNPVHTQCMDMWIGQKKKTNAAITCIFCRSPWEDPRITSNFNVSRGRFTYHEYENFSNMY